MRATETSEPDDPAAKRAAIAEMGLPDVDAFIDKARDPSVPLAVFLAALDRYTALTSRPAAEKEAEPADA